MREIVMISNDFGYYAEKLKIIVCNILRKKKYQVNKKKFSMEVCDNYMRTDVSMCNTK